MRSLTPRIHTETLKCGGTYHGYRLTLEEYSIGLMSGLRGPWL